MSIRLMFLPWLISMPAVAAADNLLSCVDPNVVQAFLGGGASSEYRIVDTIPPEFSGLDYPQDFDLIGTRHTRSFVNTAFRTNQTPDNAIKSLEAAMVNSGWTVVDNRRANALWRGFQDAKTTSRRGLTTLCDENDSAISLSSGAADPGTIVHLFKSASAQRNECNQGGQFDSSEDMGLTNDLMPNLYLPEGASRSGSGRGGIIRASGDDAETHVRITSGKRSNEILEHFSGQLSRQGWLLDSTWFGRRSVGSTWILDQADLPTTAGTLVILQHGPGDHTAQFSMIAL